MSELREAIARAIGAYLEEKGFSCLGTVGFDPTGDFDLNIDTEDVADAALAAIDAAGQQIVSKKFSVQPVPGEGLQSKYDFPEGTTVTFSQQGIGGGGGRARGGAEGGPNPRPRSEGQ